MMTPSCIQFWNLSILTPIYTFCVTSGIIPLLVSIFPAKVFIGLIGPGRTLARGYACYFRFKGPGWSDDIHQPASMLDPLLLGIQRNQPGEKWRGNVHICQALGWKLCSFYFRIIYFCLYIVLLVVDWGKDSII